MHPDWDPHDVIGAIQGTAAPEPVFMLLEAYGGDPYGPADELLRRLCIERQALEDSREEFGLWQGGWHKFMPEPDQIVRFP